MDTLNRTHGLKRAPFDINDIDIAYEPIYMLHILYKCVKIMKSFFPTSPFPQVAPCLSRARSGTPLIWGVMNVMATTLLAASKCIQMSKTEATKWQHNEQKESENGSMHSSGSASPTPSWSRCYIGQNDFSAGGLSHQIWYYLLLPGPVLACLGLS